jgi:hypothetical protein
MFLTKLRLSTYIILTTSRIMHLFLIRNNTPRTQHLQLVKQHFHFNNKDDFQSRNFTLTTDTTKAEVSLQHQVRLSEL